MTKYPAYKVAAMHVSPVFLDSEATIDKACALIQEAARHGARLIAFPETYVPAFPVWCAVRAPLYNHDFFRALAASALRIDGPQIARLASTARKCGVIVSMGFNEGSEASVGCIWNSNVLIDADGRILNHHRKLVPTFWEKLVWANGDGAGLRVCNAALGSIGMLICGENTNPLARFTLMAQGEQVHISSFPPLWPTREPGEAARYDVGDATRIRVRNHSFEGKLFNVVASGHMDARMRDGIAKSDRDVARILDETPGGVSVVVGPGGQPVSKECAGEEGIVYADIDLADCVEPKQFHDVVGYYNRFDIFQLTVDRSANRPVTFEPSAQRAAIRAPETKDLVADADAATMFGHS